MAKKPKPEVKKRRTSYKKNRLAVPFGKLKNTKKNRACHYEF
jgi:hypothetical protein